MNPPTKTCYRCGSRHHLLRGCPVKLRCYTCGSEEHLFRDCNNAGTRTTLQQNRLPLASASTAFIPTRRGYYRRPQRVNASSRPQVTSFLGSWGEPESVVDSGPPMNNSHRTTNPPTLGQRRSKLCPICKAGEHEKGDCPQVNRRINPIDRSYDHMGGIAPALKPIKTEACIAAENSRDQQGAQAVAKEQEVKIGGDIYEDSDQPTTSSKERSEEGSYALDGEPKSPVVSEKKEAKEAKEEEEEEEEKATSRNPAEDDGEPSLAHNDTAKEEDRSDWLIDL